MCIRGVHWRDVFNTVMNIHVLQNAMNCLPIRATVGSTGRVLCLELLSDNIQVTSCMQVYYVCFREIWQS
jgi:hypothetical protein